MASSLRFAALALALAGAGCGDEPCARRSDCSAGQVCTAAGVCAPVPDAGAGDAAELTIDTGRATGQGGPR